MDKYNDLKEHELYELADKGDSKAALICAQTALNKGYKNMALNMLNKINTLELDDELLKVKKEIADSCGMASSEKKIEKDVNQKALTKKEKIDAKLTLEEGHKFKRANLQTSFKERPTPAVDKKN